MLLAQSVTRVKKEFYLRMALMRELRNSSVVQTPLLYDSFICDTNAVILIN